MQNILVIHPFRVLGGAEYSLLELLNNNNDIKWFLLTNKSDKLPNFKEKIKTEIQIYCNDNLCFCKQNLKNSNCFKSIYNILTISIQILYICKKNKINIVLCNTYISLIFCGLSKICGLKIVCIYRDNINSSVIKNFIYYFSNHIILVSEFLKKQFNQKSNKISVIHNGISQKKFPHIDDCKYKHLTLKNLTYIANIGHFVPWKRHDIFINVVEKIIKLHPNTHFIIIGQPIDKSYYVKIIDIISSKGLNSFFTILKDIDSIDICYRYFDFVIHSALYEPFGRVIIESMNLGKPVISFNQGGPSEIILNHINGFLVENNNIDEMIEKASFLIENENLRKIMGDNAIQHIQKNFNSKILMPKYKEVLSKCINRSSINLK